MAKYKANSCAGKMRQLNKNTSASRRAMHLDDVVVRSTYALYTEILDREKNEIDNAVYTLQRIRASSSK